MSKNNSSIFINHAINNKKEDQNWGWYGELRRQTQSSLDKDNKTVKSSIGVYTYGVQKQVSDKSGTKLKKW